MSLTHYRSPTLVSLVLIHHVLKRLSTLLPLSVSLQILLPNTASNDIQQHVNSGDIKGLWLCYKAMRGGSAGTSVRDTESQEGTCESLKGPIALDSGRFSHDLGYTKIFDIILYSSRPDFTDYKITSTSLSNTLLHYVCHCFVSSICYLDILLHRK